MNDNIKFEKPKSRYQLSIGLGPGIELPDSILVVDTYYYPEKKKEKIVSITESQFDALWDKYLNKSFNKEDLKKELGF